MNTFEDLCVVYTLQHLLQLSRGEMVPNDYVITINLGGTHLNLGNLFQ
jgi:hypothetical protein